CPVRIEARVAEVDLIDDGQHRDLEQDRMQPRALDGNGDLAVQFAFADVYASFGQMEQAQEINEVAFDEAQISQVLQFFVCEAQLAQCVHFVPDLVEIGSQVDAWGTALVPVLDLGSGKMMQYHLHH